MTGAATGPFESRGGFPVHAGDRPAAIQQLERWRASRRGLLGFQKTATESRNLVLSLAAMNCRVCPLLSENTETAAGDTSSPRHIGSYLADRQPSPGSAARAA